MSYKPRGVRERLLARRFVNDAGCWNWTGSKNANGYGVMQLCGLRRNNRTRLVHRVAAHLWMGMALSSHLAVLHRCDNPACFNPQHLFLGTQQDNVRDAVAKGRIKGPTGNRNHATLNDGIVSQIRDMKARGVRAADIHRELDIPVSYTQLCKILRGEAWV